MQNNGLWFAHFTHWISHITGRPVTFLVACAAIVIWGVTGPLFGYSDTWQLVINTATTIITFLMVFVIQNTQNRDTAALQIKLDEMIRVTTRASNTLLNLEELDDETLETMRKNYAGLAKERSGTDAESSEAVRRKSTRAKKPKS
jgi:low affinity Fe/Cu permease